MKPLKMNKSAYVLILLSVVSVLFIYPWTKETEKFRSEDINWKILKSAKEINKFYPDAIMFRKKYDINEKLKKLNNEKIEISGFFKKEKHKNETDFFLTETVTDVCFMCNHDEQYSFIKLIPENNRDFTVLKNDSLIKVAGIFKIDTNENARFVFVLKNAVVK